MLGLVSMPYQGVYSASKYALEALSDALRIEVNRFGIDVVLIEPGWISTAFLKTATSLTPREWLNDDAYGLQLSKYFEVSSAAGGQSPRGMNKVIASLAGTPEDVATTVIKAVEAKRPHARYTVTALAKWLPRLARWTPTRIWDDIQARQVKTD
jgi:short-subunit dehydrogenase